MQCFTWNLPRADAMYLYELLRSCSPSRYRLHQHQMLMGQVEIYLDANPYRRADGSFIPSYDAIRTYPTPQESVGLADGQ